MPPIPSESSDPLGHHPSLAGLAESARTRLELLLDQRLEIVPARLAATVLLLRDHAGQGLQVLMQERARGMRFAPGQYVFPGGAVEPKDRVSPANWQGPAPEVWAASLGLSTQDAVGVVAAAVRETAEESGVRLGMGVNAYGLDTAGLRHWCTWVTPAWSERRFATTFLAAAFPEDQAAWSASDEVARTCWISPRRAWLATGADALTMMLPTRATLRELAAYDSVADALARPPDVLHRQIRHEVIEGELRLVIDTPRGTLTKDRYLLDAHA